MKRLMIGLSLAALLSLSAAQAALAWPDDAQAALSTSPVGTTVCWPAAEPGCTMV